MFIKIVVSKVGKKLQKQFLINLQAGKWILPSLNLPDETKKVTKILIFAPFCGYVKRLYEDCKGNTQESNS